MAPTTMFILVFVLLSAIVEADGQYGMLDFSPRFLFGAIAKRQSDGESCSDGGFHSCAEINSTNACCADDSYCYLAPAGVPSCCQIGSDCQNQCTSSEIAIQQNITVSGSATSTFSCEARLCTAASAYQCDLSFGGGCCSYGSSCTSSGSCVSTIDSSTVIPASSTATGCSTGQFSCPTAEGGGCCGNGAKCTALDSTLLCVATVTTGSFSGITPTAIRTGPSGITDANFTDTSSTSSSSSSTLSSGAKAGIGIGVALGVVVVAIAVFWFALSRRAAHRRYLAQSASGGITRSESEKRTPKTKNGTDYFGPTAQPGPYTDTVASDVGLNRGVPLSPQGPDDFAAPVEIGESAPVVVPETPYVSETPEKPEFRIELP